MNGNIINTFWAFQLATSIAEVERFSPNRHTPISGVLQFSAPYLFVTNVLSDKNNSFLFSIF